MSNNLEDASTHSNAVKTPLITTLIILIFVVLLLVFSRNWSANILRNVGYLWLNRATAVTNTESIQKTSQKAKESLQAGEKSTEDKQPFLYGLGFAAALQENENVALTQWQQLGNMFAATLTFGKQSLAAGDVEAAERWFERAARLNPRAADAWYYQGLTALRSNKSADAEAYFDRATTEGYTFLLTPKSEVLCTLGWYYHWQAPTRDPKRAESYYSAGLTNNQFDTTVDTIDCYYKRNQVRQFYTQDLTGAAEDLSAILLLDPHNLLVRSELVWVNYLRSGDIETAVATLTDLQQKKPRDKWAFERLADIYKHIGQNKQALEMYQAAIALDPQNQQLQAQIESLKTVHNE